MLIILAPAGVIIGLDQLEAGTHLVWFVTGWPAALLDASLTSPEGSIIIAGLRR